jgi:hypothetical protein
MQVTGVLSFGQPATSQQGRGHVPRVSAETRGTTFTADVRDNADVSEAAAAGTP